jgi:hypothetical protein
MSFKPSPPFFFAFTYLGPFYQVVFPFCMASLTEKVLVLSSALATFLGKKYKDMINGAVI